MHFFHQKDCDVLKIHYQPPPPTPPVVLRRFVTTVIPSWVCKLLPLHCRLSVGGTESCVCSTSPDVDSNSAQTDLGSSWREKSTVQHAAGLHHTASLQALFTHVSLALAFSFCTRSQSFDFVKNLCPVWHVCIEHSFFCALVLTVLLNLWL